MKMPKDFSIRGMAILMLVFVCGASQALEYDFEKADQLSDWKDLAGKSEIRDGLLCSVSAVGGPLVCVIDDWKDEWSDYTITVKAMGLNSDADWGIAFRVQDIGNHYSWQYCNSCLMFVTYIGGSRSEVCEVAQGEVLNQWQDFEVDVKGNTFDLYWNGKLIKTVEHDALETGKVGVFVWINSGQAVGDLGGVAFDDFTVNGKGIPTTLKAVEPKGKLAVTWAIIKAQD